MRWRWHFVTFNPGSTVYTPARSNMYSYLKGSLIEATPTHVILDVQGMGFMIHIPVSLFSQLPPLSEALQLHTAFVIREFSQTLYGFLHARERDLFSLLIDAKGVGPKMALSLLGHLPLDAFLQAVRMHDIHALSRVPGIGKKTAERLLVELRDKLAPWEALTKRATSPARFSLTSHDAVGALMQLGYSAAIAQDAVESTLKEFSEESDLSTLIATALQKTRR